MCKQCVHSFSPAPTDFLFHAAESITHICLPSCFGSMSSMMRCDLPRALQDVLERVDAATSDWLFELVGRSPYRMHRELNRCCRDLRGRGRVANALHGAFVKGKALLSRGRLTRRIMRKLLWVGLSNLVPRRHGFWPREDTWENRNNQLRLVGRWLDATHAVEPPIAEAMGVALPAASDSVEAPAAAAAAASTLMTANADHETTMTITELGSNQAMVTGMENLILLLRFQRLSSAQQRAALVADPHHLAEVVS